MHVPSLDNKEVHVVIMRDDDQVTSTLIADYYTALSPEDKKKHQAFHFEKDKRLFLLSRALMSHCLSNYVQSPYKELNIGKNAYGKPYLIDFPELNFNLSHSGQCVAFCITKQNIEIGIDIECFIDRGELLNLAESTFTTEEYRHVLYAAAEHRSFVFFQIWTLKEAYIKALGKGLSHNLKSFSFNVLHPFIKVIHKERKHMDWRFYQTTVFDDYLLAFAARGDYERLECTHIKTYETLPYVYFRKQQLSYVTSNNEDLKN